MIRRSSLRSRRSSKDALHSMLANLQHLNLTDQIQNDSPVLKAHGGYCDVFIGRWLRNGECIYKVAIKRLRVHIQSDRDFAKFLANEIRVWSKLGHCNILPLLGYVVEGEYPSLISEWMEDGTVSRYIIEHPECDVLTMILGIAEGLKYLHDEGVIHSDIKADNVLVSRSGVPRICDFGISRMLAASQTFGGASTQTGGIRGSVRWMAIELLVISDPPAKHSTQSDIWAFGMTVYELLTRTLPYANLKHDLHVMFAILQGDQPRFPESFDDWPECYQKIWGICCSCWNPDPNLRYSMEHVVSYLRFLYQRRDEERIRTKRDAHISQAAHPGQARVAMNSLGTPHEARPSRSMYDPAVHNEFQDMYSAQGAPISCDVAPMGLTTSNDSRPSEHRARPNRASPVSISAARTDQGHPIAENSEKQKSRLPHRARRRELQEKTGSILERFVPESSLTLVARLKTFSVSVEHSPPSVPSRSSRQESEQVCSKSKEIKKHVRGEASGDRDGLIPLLHLPSVSTSSSVPAIRLPVSGNAIAGPSSLRHSEESDVDQEKRYSPPLSKEKSVDEDWRGSVANSDNSSETLTAKSFGSRTISEGSTRTKIDEDRQEEEFGSSLKHYLGSPGAPVRTLRRTKGTISTFKGSVSKPHCMPRIPRRY
ncbi:hypothetical protein M0805_008218 [Coniferiporia weirii]|nr:hypothetical protein M0805_008218 [Coniferiporia weirii]